MGTDGCVTAEGSGAVPGYVACGVGCPGTPGGCPPYGDVGGTGPGGALGNGAALVRAEGRGRCLSGTVAVRGARRGRLDRAGQRLCHRLVDAARELPGLGQALIAEEFGEADRPHNPGRRAHLPGALPAIELQGDHGRLGVQGR
ncbi:hypothetical protein GCM10011428_08490 [Streptomyces violaceus]